MFRKGKIGWTIWNIVEGLILITAGVLFCAYSNNSSFQSTCVLIVAILVIIDAVLRLALNVISVFGLGDLKLIKTDFAAAISGTSELTLGIGLVFLQQDLSKGDILFEAIGRFVGIFLIVLSIIMAVYGIVYIVKKLQSVGVSVVYFLIAAIGLALGIVALVFLTKSENIRMLVFIVLGILLLAAGLAVIYFTIALLVKAKKVVKAVESVKKDFVDASGAVEETPTSDNAVEEQEESKEEPTDSSEENKAE